MNAYFFKMTNEERSNILDQHKEVYDGYVTQYSQPGQQPLYVQDYANDKGGINVNNRGEVSTYRNTNINEMHADGKSTGLFSSEEPKEGYIPAGSEYTPEETFESEFEVVTDFSDDDDNFMVSVGAHKDMVGDGNHDLEHGTFGHEDEEDEILVSPESDLDMFDDEDEDDSPFGLDIDSLFNLDNEEDYIEEETKEQVVSKINESLDMFKRLSKYN